MARSNFPREDDESKFKRGQTKVVNKLVSDFVKLTGQEGRDVEAVRAVVSLAYLEGWKAAVRLAIRTSGRKAS